MARKDNTYSLPNDSFGKITAHVTNEQRACFTVSLHAKNPEEEEKFLGILDLHPEEEAQKALRKAWGWPTS